MNQIIIATTQPRRIRFRIPEKYWGVAWIIITAMVIFELWGLMRLLIRLGVKV